MAAVEVSLDGGAHYQPAALVGERWAFELASWTGPAALPYALVRASDPWNNVTRGIARTDPDPDDVRRTTLLRPDVPIPDDHPLIGGQLA